MSEAELRPLGRSLWMPVMVAAAVRAGLLVWAYAATGTRVLTQGDTASYLEPGWNLVHLGQYVSGGVPEIDRTPGYPLFLMVAGMARGNVLLVAGVQILASILTLLLVRRIAMLVFRSERVGWAAAWLFALEPVSVLYTVRLMPETVFVLLMTAVVERTLTYFETARPRSLLWAGLLLAMATFVRPVSYYLAAPLALGVLAFGAVHGRGWAAFKHAVVLLVCVAPFLAGWQLRNWAETGFDGFSSIVAINLYFYQAAEVAAELEQIPFTEEQRRLGYPTEDTYVAAHPKQRIWSHAKRAEYMKSEAIKVLSAHRMLYLNSHLRGVFVVAFTPCASELLQLTGMYPRQGDLPQRVLGEGIFRSAWRVSLAHPATAVVMALFEVYLLLLYAAAAIGLWKGSGSGWGLTLLVGVAAYFLLISGGAQAVGRYRLPLVPEVCVLAAGGVFALVKQKRDLERSRMNEFESPKPAEGGPPYARL